MAINRKVYTFVGVNNAPEKQGVYALYDGQELIYIGRASGEGVTIRSRLQAHHRGDDGRCTQQAIHYRREVTTDPISREQELLEEYKRAHDGRLPHCSERVG